LKSDKQNADGLQLCLIQIVKNYLSIESMEYIHTDFESHDGKLIACLNVDPASAPVYLKRESRSDFYVRLGNSSQPLGMEETVRYVQSHWPKLTGEARYRKESAEVAQPGTNAAPESQKQDLAQRHILRLKFWAQLLARAKEKGVMVHSARSPSKDHWLSVGAGRSGLSFNYVVWQRQQETAVELYIDTGDKSETKHIFDQLHVHKKEIEADFGHELMWERLEDERGARIRYIMREGGLADESNWIPMQDAMIDAMKRLSEAIKPRIQMLSE